MQRGIEAMDVGASERLSWKGGCRAEENPGGGVGLQLKSNDPTPDGWETNAHANIWSMPAAQRSMPHNIYRSH